jgi:hypothetical protein
MRGLISMRRFAGLLLAISLFGCVLTASTTASAKDHPPIAVAPEALGQVRIDVQAPGHPGPPAAAGNTERGGAPSNGDVSAAVCTNTDAHGSGCDPCAEKNTQTPACLAYEQSVFCFQQNGAGVAPAVFAAYMQTIGCAVAPVAAAAPNPAKLAQSAYGLLNLPKPSIGRSPPPESSDPRFGGQAFTWVNFWTFYWTSPKSWRPMSKTVAAGGVSATATAKPVSLTFDPGDGNSPVTCAGPGRPWTESDANDAPTDGACAYMYTRVTDGDTPLTSTVSIQWDVTWTGNRGETGTLPVLQTQATSQFIVEQIQTVNR